jgi:DNA-directed RNA polymerase specialized sigma24 family protein
MNELSEPTNYVNCPTTRWTSVIQAIQSDDETKALAALRFFCEQYRDVIFRFFNRRVGPDLADNYTQEFFLKKIHGKWEQRKGLLFQIKRESGGKFRYFLISALIWFDSDMRKTKQDPLKHTISELPDLPTPSNEEDKIARECDREVALALIRRVMKRLQVSEVYLKYFCEQISADQAASELAVSSGTFRVAVHRLVPAIKGAFREEVRAIVASEADVDDEIRHLLPIIAESRNAAP